MARLARLVVPGVPHHVTQRGARRQLTFFQPADYRLYRLLLRKEASRWGLSVWAYCLMPNHVHLIAVPGTCESLARTLRRVHCRYAELVNRRHGWRGHLWQERFFSCPLSDRRLWTALRYVLLNPVRAGLSADAADWPWSSARGQLGESKDAVVDVEALRARIPTGLLSYAERGDDAAFEELRCCSRTGRPMGDESYLRELEKRLGVSVERRRPGRPRRPVLIETPETTPPSANS